MNYEELCNLINVGQNKHDRQRHIKKLQRDYNIKVISKNNYEYYGKFTDVQKIENNPTKKKDRMYLEPMIYTRLMSKDTNVIEEKMRDLLLMFGLVNQSYYPVKYDTDIAEEIININGYNNFIDFTEPLLKRIIYEVLIDMKDKLLIDLEFIPYGVNMEYFYSDCKRSFKKYPHEYNLKDNADTYEKYQFAYYKAVEEKGYRRESRIKWFDQMPIRKRTAELLNYDWIYFKYKISINRKAIQEYITNDFYGMRHSANYYIQNKIKNNKHKYEFIADEEIDIYINMLIDDKNIYKFDEKIKEIKKKKEDEERERIENE